VSRAARVLGAAAVILTLPMSGWSRADGCPAASSGDLGHALVSPRYLLSYRTRPEQVEVGQHFAVELVVCPRAGAPWPPESVRVDAHMPEHRHGMNYKAAVTAEGEGRYRADGLLFHMPGLWEFLFEVRAGGHTDRVTRGVELE
jgi:hypothetical protein